MDTTDDIIKLEATYTLEVLKLIKEAQQQHGLRHYDYQRYRSYCSRRLRRLRKTLNFVCGNQRRFQKKELNVAQINDVKYLLLPLFQAERAWSYAMQLKQESNEVPRRKFHLVNRLRKAINHSNELEKLCSDSKFDARSKLEAQGYNAWMNGQYYFESQKWEESLKFFNIAQKIYQKLSSALNGDDLQAIYLQRADEIVPNIRYCQYNIGDETAIKDLTDLKLKSTGSDMAENIDLLISQTKEKQIKTLSEFTWRNKTLQIKNEKVRLFLLNVQEYEKQIQSTADLTAKLNVYDDILKESIDVIQIMRDELKNDPTFKLVQRGQTLEEKPSNLVLLFSYLTYIRLIKTVERNLLMIVQLTKQSEDDKKLSKPQDIIRIYDIIIQNYNEISNLPGLNDDHDLSSENEFNVTYYSAFRSYYICVFYLNDRKFKESVGFCFQIDKYIKTIEKKLKELPAKTQVSATTVKSELDTLKKNLNNLKYKLQATALLDQDVNVKENENEKSKKQVEKKSLVDRLDTYDDSPAHLEVGNVTSNFGSEFLAIPCKPLFFDLALNHVELPSYDEKIDTKKNQQQQAGVKGFFKGLLGFN